MGAVYKSYISSAILHGCEAWCLKESEMGILQWIERSMVREMCGVQLKDRKRAMDVMMMLDLNVTMDHLAPENSVDCYGNVSRREDGHDLRRALDFEVEVQRKKGSSKRTWKKQVEEESVKVGFEQSRCPFADLGGCWY